MVFRQDVKQSYKVALIAANYTRDTRNTNRQSIKKALTANYTRVVVNRQSTIICTMYYYYVTVLSQ